MNKRFITACLTAALLTVSGCGQPASPISGGSVALSAAAPSEPQAGGKPERAEKGRTESGGGQGASSSGAGNGTLGADAATTAPDAAAGPAGNAGTASGTSGGGERAAAQGSATPPGEAAASASAAEPAASAGQTSPAAQAAGGAQPAAVQEPAGPGAAVPESKPAQPEPAVSGQSVSGASAAAGSSASGPVAAASGSSAKETMPWKNAGNTPTLTFAELYSDITVRGVKLSDKVAGLADKKVEMVGYMAPPLTAQASFFVLTRVALTVCPFCSSDADWPTDIVVVLMPKGKEILPTEHQVKVTGTLSIGSQTDEETGFVSLIRMMADKVEVLK
ncbi:hypothetical protein WBG83_11805 [Paenibacillus sp. y28]